MTLTPAFDWETEGPGPRALEAFAGITDEAEFPDTYSGQSWRVAYKIWKAYRDRAADLDAIGPYDDIPGVALDGLGLSGFMVGWGMNAARQMLGRAPGPNGAIIEVGAGDAQPVTPAMGPAEADMHRAIGGEAEN